MCVTVQVTSYCVTVQVTSHCVTVQVTKSLCNCAGD